MAKWKNKKTTDLIQAFLVLKTKQEMNNFLRDLLTEEEIIEFGQRWFVAQMLANKVPYTEITRKTGLSSTTIARVAKWLNPGMGGYQLVLKRLKK